MNQEFEEWLYSFIKLSRCILDKSNNDRGYWVAWDDLENLTYINTETWL